MQNFNDPPVIIDLESRPRYESHGPRIWPPRIAICGLFRQPNKPSSQIKKKLISNSGLAAGETIHLDPDPRRTYSFFFLLEKGNKDYLQLRRSYIS